MNQRNMSEKDGEKRYLLKYRETFSIKVDFRGKAKTRARVSQLKGRSFNDCQQAMEEEYTNAVSCHGLRLLSVDLCIHVLGCM